MQGIGRRRDDGPALTSCEGDRGDLVTPAACARDLVRRPSGHFVECGQRLARLEDPAVLSLHQRQTAYTDLYQGLDAIDDPDEIEVVLDAHDLALSVPGLVFWTGDSAHIMQNRGLVLKMTGVGDVRYLGDVSN